MLVDDALRAAVSSVDGHRAGRLRDVVVDQASEAWRAWRAITILEEEEQLILALGQRLECVGSRDRDVVFLLRA